MFRLTVTNKPANRLSVNDSCHQANSHPGLMMSGIALRSMPVYTKGIWETSSMMTVPLKAGFLCRQACSVPFMAPGIAMFCAAMCV